MKILAVEQLCLYFANQSRSPFLFKCESAQQRAQRLTPEGQTVPLLVVANVCLILRRFKCRGSAKKPNTNTFFSYRQHQRPTALVR